MSFLIEFTLKPRSSYFTQQQYQGFFIGMFVDSKSFQRTKIILLWPCNKMICLIKQFYGLWPKTYHANKWGKKPKILQAEWLCYGFRTIWLSAPSNAPFHLCFSVTSLINATFTKRRGCLKLLCCPCTFIHMTKQLSHFPMPCSRGEVGWLLTILHLSGSDLNVTYQSLKSTWV